MEIIKFNFFTDPPLDFELKKYRILSYVNFSDKNYIELQFSPWLLNNKILLLDLKNFITNLETTKERLSKKKISYREGSIFYEKTYPEKLDSLEVIRETVLYSIPIFEKSNEFGSELSNSSGTILW